MLAEQKSFLDPETQVRFSSGEEPAASFNLTEIQALTAQFAGIDRMTEESFLVIGQQVKRFHHKAGEISANSVRVLQLLEGETGEQSLIKLQLLVERCSLWLDDAQAQTTQIVVTLERIVTQMARMAAPLQGLRKLIKTLQGLRVSTRIETARVPGTGAQILSDDLKRLTNLIQSKVQQVEDQFETIGVLSNGMLEHQRQIGRGPLRIAQTGIQENRQLLSKLSDQQLETGHRTESLKRQSEQISAHFAEIIMALQFQDITRQRLEHIQHALEDLSEQISVAQSQTPALSDEETMSVTGEVCRLQLEHLEEAVEEFDSAVDNLTQNLSDMVVSVRNLGSDTSRFGADVETAPGTEQLSGTALLQSVTDQLEAVLERHSDASSTIRTVCNQVGEISKQIDAVEYIGEEMQLMAFNAAINAAHCRGRGAGLQVIAGQIQSLAEGAFARTVALADECRLVAEQAEGLVQLDEVGKQLEARLTDLVDEGRDLFKALHENRQELTGLLQEVSRETDLLEEDVTVCRATIDVRESFRTVIAPVLDGLRVLSCCSPVLSDEENEVRTDLFRKIHARYTMQSERTIHDSLEVDRDASIYQQAAADDGSEDSTVHDLGDNVELF